MYLKGSDPTVSTGWLIGLRILQSPEGEGTSESFLGGESGMLREMHQRLTTSLGTAQNSKLSGKCRKLRQAVVQSMA